MPYGSAFEGEVVRRADMRIEFGGKNSRAFEYLRMVPMEEVEDGDIEVIGPGIEAIEDGGTMDLGLLIEVAGRKMQTDFEPVLERQIHYFVNGASGVQHIGQRDIAWIRIAKAAADKGFNLRHFGEILHARLHADFGAIVDKVQVKIITDQALHAEWLAQGARGVRLSQPPPGRHDRRVGGYLLLLHPVPVLRSRSRVHRVAGSGWACAGRTTGWTARPAYEINPTGPNQPITKGDCLSPIMGYWKGPTSTPPSASHGSVREVSLYSIMSNPMTACGCFECIVMFIPEANGVMVVSREDAGMTPAGMTFSTLAGIAGGGLQTPGLMGIGKYYLTSPKFLSADGGFKRIVWMSANLKESMADELKIVAEREGIPDLLDRIADGKNVTEVSDLVKWLEEHDHPALKMAPMQAAEAEVVEAVAEQAPVAVAAAPAAAASAAAEVADACRARSRSRARGAARACARGFQGRRTAVDARSAGRSHAGVRDRHGQRSRRASRGRGERRHCHGSDPPGAGSGAQGFGRDRAGHGGAGCRSCSCGAGGCRRGARRSAACCT